jgi:hypothetical protein
MDGLRHSLGAYAMGVVQPCGRNGYMYLGTEMEKGAGMGCRSLELYKCLERISANFSSPC